MLLEARAVEAVEALVGRRIPVILLKGPVTAAWLYPAGRRTYVDIDLLVAPSTRQDAVLALASLGYSHWLAGADACEFGGATELELMGLDGVCVDLHRTLLGVGADAERCWTILSGRTEPMDLVGRTVTVLDAVARTLHLALHAAQNGPVDSKALLDLELGLSAVPENTWREAAELAADLDATQAFASGLRVLEPGRQMADRLRLPAVDDVELVLRSRSASPFALQIQAFVEARSLAERANLVRRKLWPTRVYMAVTYPETARGPRALLAARLRRLAGLPHKFVVALRAWNDARRTVKSIRRARPSSPPDGPR